MVSVAGVLGVTVVLTPVAVAGAGVHGTVLGGAVTGTVVGTSEVDVVVAGCFLLGAAAA
jgi:hypothetical protein